MVDEAYQAGARDEAIKGLKERADKTEALLQKLMLATLIMLAAQVLELITTGVP